MDRNIRINWLTDFYGAMLTERQRNVIELHYGDDLSLGEIAENMSISRQAVHDALKRGVSQLEDYENKLKLLNRYLEIEKRLLSIMNDVKELPKENVAAERLEQKLDELMTIWEA